MVQLLSKPAHYFQETGKPQVISIKFMINANSRVFCRLSVHKYRRFVSVPVFDEESRITNWVFCASSQFEFEFLCF